MGAITYTALREFEPTGFAKTGTDISAAAADDSFNASSTVLTGLLTDEWVLTTGFAAAANNGWFQAKSNSTSTKILELTGAITHVRLPAVASNFASTPDTVANSVPGSIELMCKVAPTDATPAASQVLIAKNGGAPNIDYQLAFDAGSTGKLVFTYTTDGTTTTGRIATSTVAVPFADLATFYAKVTYNSATGIVQFFTAGTNVVFSQLGTNVALTAGAIHNGTSTLTVGANSAGTSPFGGRIYYAEVRNGIAGSIVAAFDASRGLRNGTTIIAATGETWTINTSGTPPAMLQGSELVTAAAAPAIALVGYRRGLNQSYNLEFYSERVDRSVEEESSEQQPIGGGAPETLFYRQEVFIDVVVVGPLGALITEAQMLQWREFMASTQGGEQFIFDRYGTIASPVESKIAMRASKGYMEERIAGAGNSGLYKLAFKVRLLN